MTRLSISLLGAALILALSACGDAPTDPRAGSALDATGTPTHHHAADRDGGPRVTRAAVVPFGQPDGPVLGHSVMRRHAHGIHVRMETSELVPGDAVTLWAVVFNKPHKCSPPSAMAARGAGGDARRPMPSCGEDDVSPDSPAQVDILYVAGGVVDEDGRLAFRGMVHRHDVDGSIFHKLGLPAPGLTHPNRAEVHFVGRTHGPNDPANPDMTTTFAGGCDDPFDSGGALGREGPNTCEDVQMSIHEPPQARRG